MKNYSLANLILGGVLGAALLVSRPQSAPAQTIDEPPAAPETQGRTAPSPVIRVFSREAPAEAEKAFIKALVAIEDGNRSQFMALAEEKFRATLTPPVFKAMVDQVGSRLQEGYETSYLGDLERAGSVVHVWSITFSNSKDDLLVQMSLKDGKVSGFLLD